MPRSHVISSQAKTWIAPTSASAAMSIKVALRVNKWAFISAQFNSTTRVSSWQEISQGPHGGSILRERLD